MPACQISCKSWARQDQLCHLAFILFLFEPTLSKFPNFQIQIILFQINPQNSKMTCTKKTLGCNWTRYHNYYGMNHILEAACIKKLHWDWEALHDYTINHTSCEESSPSARQR